MIMFCSGCNKQPLPSNLDHIDTPALEEMIKEVGLSWKIVEKGSWGVGRTFFECVNEDNLSIATISVAKEENKTVLQFSFFSTTELSTPLPAKDWEKVFQLASILYGGFDDETQFYQTFLNTCEEAEFIERIVDNNKESIRWRNSINDINCFVGFDILNTNSDSEASELFAIFLS